jgi:hypothetical protein
MFLPFVRRFNLLDAAEKAANVCCVLTTNVADFFGGVGYKAASNRRLPISV